MTIEKLKADLNNMTPRTPKEIEVSTSYLRSLKEKEEATANRSTALALIEAKINKLEKLIKG